MPQHPAAHPPRSDSPTEEVTPVRPPAAELTINKVLAGAGAAATTAVLGSFFGAAGTVTGAALGSVASTVATTVYQRSLDRTQQTLAARIRPADPSADAGESPAVPRRRWKAWAAATVLVFVLGLLAVTGVEWAKGSTITSGDSGTSVGRVLGAAPATTAPAEAPAPATETTDGSTPAPTSSARSSEEPSATPSPEPSSSRTEPTGTSSTPTTAASPTGTAG